MNRTMKWFLALVLAQLVFLLAWAGYHEYVRQNSPVLLLKGRPVDPQDMLRGDYLTLAYDISSAAVPAGPGPAVSPGSEAGSDVWVLLERRDRYFVVAQASSERLVAQPGQFLVRGTRAGDWRRGQSVNSIHYGIESYFVPEGRGSPHFQLMEVEVSVSPAHRLYLRRVLLDGKAFP